MRSIAPAPENTHYYVDLAGEAGELKPWGTVTLLALPDNLRGLHRPKVIVLGPADMYAP
ncbi:hypothetical protein QC334_34570 [Streptomyces sp. DH18]|uniref:hypothetical protein n=1 Tax=Streptomyces sp. DH18 TaxID=3040126 RepID=UPI0024425738|nr:hypothetical protein [Streptomyces sp. DH18]MDG9687795.1 hypothetical protein [Streptomyces sp. DH18]